MLVRGLIRGLLRGLKRGVSASLGLPPLVVGTALAATDDTTNQNAYGLGTISLAANELGLLFVVQTAGTASGVASFTGTFGGSWTLVAERAVAGIRVQCYRTLNATPLSGTVIANFAGGDVTTGCEAGAAKVLNARRSGTNGADAIEQSTSASVAAATTAAVALPSPLRSGSVMIYCLNHSANEPAAPGTFTELGDVDMATPNQGFIFAWGLAQSDAPAWTTSAASRWIAVEVRQ